MLYIVSTPIGHPKDITLRALEVLDAADFIIGEEQRIASTFLKRLKLSHKTLHLLNEHSTERDVEELTQLCKNHQVALISDCGTPSFYDPGYQLIQQCRKKNILATAVPGASSLMTLLSLVSQQVNQFYFAGFLPADNEQRSIKFQALRTHSEPLILMDTPYRLLKLLTELDTHFSQRQILLGLNLTQESEMIIEGTPQNLIRALTHRGIEKAEFILLIYKDQNQQRSVTAPTPPSFKASPPQRSQQRSPRSSKAQGPSHSSSSSSSSSSLPWHRAPKKKSSGRRSP